LRRVTRAPQDQKPRAEPKPKPKPESGPVGAAPDAQKKKPQPQEDETSYPVDQVDWTPGEGTPQEMANLKTVQIDGNDVHIPKNRKLTPNLRVAIKRVLSDEKHPELRQMLDEMGIEWENE